MKKQQIIPGIGILIVFTALYFVSKFSAFEDASWLKLAVLLGTILIGATGISLLFNRNSYVLNISRIFVAILFIFSGFVKAVDPLGSKYKFIDYFEAWHLDFLAPTALTFGIILSTLEFVVGLALLCKIQPKISSWLSFLFMIVFTPITLYLAFQQNVSGKELVHDCGCFGDALILTNWQTFVKNLVILVPVLFVFIKRNTIQDVVSKSNSYKILTVFVVLVVGLSAYALMHLPPIDFRPYKIGTTLYCKKCSDIVVDENTKTYQYADFKNLKTGEHKEFEITEHYPDYTVWEYNAEVPIREEKISLEKPSDKDTVVQQKMFELNEYFFSKDKEDYTCKIITDSNFVFLLVQYDLHTTSLSNQKAINKLYDWAQSKGYAFYGATSSLDEVISDYRKKSNAKYPFVNADDISLKTIVRANPGLVLLRNGVVIDNWHGNDIPENGKIDVSKYK